MGAVANISDFRCRVARSWPIRDYRSGFQPASVARAFDMFSNPSARMGWGTPSLAEDTEYNLVRLSYNYWLLITMFRNHWISRRIVETPAKDMVRAWPRLTSEIDPKEIGRFERVIRNTATKAAIFKTLWLSRLFGGAGALIVIDGQENILDEPLDIADVELGAYKGLIPFDRWVGIYPEGELCSDINRPLDFNLPEYYRVTVPGARGFKVHSSRILRFCGPAVPTPEYEAQGYWGISSLEPPYQEVQKRDNMSWNILSLTFRASIIGMKFDDLAQMLSGAGMSTLALQGFYARMEALNQLMSNQSLIPLPKDGGFEHVAASFPGVADIYQQFQLDIAGASEIPVSRLFGRTITGLGQSNDADERIYEERIAMDQEHSMRPQLEQKLYPVICMSEFGEVPKDLDLIFPSIRVLSEQEKAELAKNTVDAIAVLFDRTIYDKAKALKDIKQSSDVTGFGTNITDEDIEAAEQEPDLPPIGAGESEHGAKDPLDALESYAGRATDSADWQESKHPRVSSGPNAGEFASGSGGSGSGRSEHLTAASASRSEWPEHIQKLKLPPAWKDVRISRDPDADLLAVGKDAKGRPQYVYSEKFRSTQAASKFARIKELDGKFDKVRGQNAERMHSDNAKERENAQCAALVMAMGIRPGSDTDTKAKVKAYGATTLEGRHVIEENGQTYLRFTGKKGVSIDLPVQDEHLAAMLRAKADRAGTNGKLFPGVSDKSLLDYTHTLNGGKFKTKDFRTLLGTREALRKIESMPPPKNEKEYKKKALEVAKTVSARLGNTPIVALQSYINPSVFAGWRARLAA